MLNDIPTRAFVDFSTSKDIIADAKKASPGDLGPHAVILITVNEKPFREPQNTIVLEEQLW